MISAYSESSKAEPERGKLPFWGIVLIYGIEYIGLGHYLPGAQKIPLFLSFSIFFGLIFTKDIREIFRFWQTKAIVVLFIHTGLSITYALVTFYAIRVFKVQVGYIILFISTYLVLNSKRKIHALMTAMVIFHCFVIIVNLDKLNTSIRAGAFKAGYFLGDGNDLSWSLAIFLPFAIYLLTATYNKITKFLNIIAIGLLTGGIIGATSRGAFLAITASIGYLVLNSRKKLASVVITAMIALLAFVFAPSAYMDRIQSIGNYQEDSSALGRIMAWKASMRMAVGHPLGVGAGNFNSAYGRFYRPTDIDLRIYAGERWISPHSVYFLILGEYGLIGLITILALLILNYRDNQQQVAALAQSPRSVLLGSGFSTLPLYLNMSLVAFSVGGAFLGGVNYPHIFLLTALILRTRRINSAERKSGEITT